MAEVRPTPAQTRVLIHLWLQRDAVPHKSGVGTPTMDVLAKRGWIVPNGGTYTLPAGIDMPMYVLSEAGFRAAQIGFASATMTS